MRRNVCCQSSLFANRLSGFFGIAFLLLPLPSVLLLLHFRSVEFLQSSFEGLIHVQLPATNQRPKQSHDQCLLRVRKLTPHTYIRQVCYGINK